MKVQYSSGPPERAFFYRTPDFADAYEIPDALMEAYETITRCRADLEDSLMALVRAQDAARRHRPPKAPGFPRLIPEKETPHG